MKNRRPVSAAQIGCAHLAADTFFLFLCRGSIQGNRFLPRDLAYAMMSVTLME